MNQELAILQHFFPEQKHLRLDHWHLDTPTGHLELTVSSTQRMAACLS